MELIASVIAVKMERNMTTELQMSLLDSVFWTDNTTVLRYIHSESQRFKTFVANRVSKIREASNVSQWRHVGTKLNPADYKSRGLNAVVFLKCNYWFLGPDFLKAPERD